jgi:transposase
VYLGVADIKKTGGLPLATKWQCIEQLGGWEGYRVVAVRSAWRGQRQVLGIELEPVSGIGRCCSGCGQQVRGMHDTQRRWVRDLPCFEAQTWVNVPRVRVACERCGPKLEQLPWLEPYARVTKRLGESVARLCRVMSIRHVAQFFELNWKTVKAIDKAHLLQTLGPVDCSGVGIIAMDEFALHKGHRYATVIVEPACKRVLWVGKGRGREDVRPFFEQLGPQGRGQLQAVVMDMNSAYELEVKAHCPAARIVFDLFHVVAKYAREVIDRVRVDEANRLRGQPHARHLIKSSRWLLLRNRENIDSRKDRLRLSELLKANKALLKVYLLKDDLKQLWDYRSVAWAKKFWDQWYRRAIYSRLEPLKRFAQRLQPYLPGILAHCQFPLHTSLLEGINNRIKVIKRMAYGYRDEEYFFLKIRAAFPGNG